MLKYQTEFCLFSFILCTLCCLSAKRFFLLIKHNNSVFFSFFLPNLSSLYCECECCSYKQNSFENWSKKKQQQQQQHTKAFFCFWFWFMNDTWLLFDHRTKCAVLACLVIWIDELSIKHILVRLLGGAYSI